MRIDKRDRFVKVTKLRVAAIVKDIRLVSNCSDQSLCGYSAKDVKKIF